MEFDKTMSFEVEREENTKCQEILKDVYQSLVEKGYNKSNCWIYIIRRSNIYNKS